MRQCPLLRNCLLCQISLFLFLCLTTAETLEAQICTLCVYYDVEHKVRIENHPVFGDWELMRYRCLPFDGENIFKVSADGTTSSKFEIRLFREDPCIYENIDPRVVFIDENYEEIDNPTSEEHGQILITDPGTNHVYFEYTHPTDLPPAGEKYREVRIALQDFSTVNNAYSTVSVMVIWVHRLPVAMVHGLWADKTSFGAMEEELRGSEYYPDMLISADYKPTNASPFSLNMNVVPSNLDMLITNCHESHLAAGKVNLVVHSMGGVLSRLYLQGNYRNDVHRLITCNTPHSGAQTANFLLDPYWNTVNQDICALLQAMKMPCYYGAVADLQVDSAAITALNTASHPAEVGVHSVITVEDAPLPSFLNTFLTTKSNLLAILMYLGNTCGEDILDTLFNGDLHDLVVAAESQAGGLLSGYTSYVNDQMHVGSTGNPEVISKVKSLLNEPLMSNKFTTGGYFAPVLSYNNSITCSPLLDGGDHTGSRNSDDLVFVGASPGDQSWQAGDTAEFTISGSCADTLIFVYEVNTDLVFMQKQAGPEATFTLPFSEDQQEGYYGVAVFGYSVDQELTCFITDSVEIVQETHLTGISVLPTKIFSGVGDTSTIEVIGHYDDGSERSLKGMLELEYHFTNWSATSTPEGDILLEIYENDTLVIEFMGFTSNMVKIYAQADPNAPVYWLGGTGLWTEDAKWNIGCPPGAMNTAYILSGECTIPPLFKAEALALNLDAASLIIDGELAISNSLPTALNINKATVENNGVLEIRNVSATGIAMQGLSGADSAFFINNGTIIMDSCIGTYGLYVGSRSEFMNSVTGILEMRSCGSFDAIQTQGGNSICFENRGMISIDGGEVGGVGRYLNSGILNINHSLPNTYQGFTATYLHNTSTGAIHIENVHNYGLFMNFSTDSLINEGSITIEHSNYRGYRVNYCRNSGSITIRDIPNHAMYMEGNNYTFENEVSGSLQIQNAGLGIYFRNTGAIFRNKGTITIDTTNDEAVLLRFNANFINDTSGIIGITGAGTRGIYVLDNASTFFTNHGRLAISGTGGNGIQVTGNSAFNNTVTGSVLLSDIGASGLATSGTSLAANSIITNAGRIDIQLPVANWSIDHTKFFTNYACGLITVEKALRSSAGNFLNEGFIHLRNTTAHSITNSAYKLLNNGLIEDYNGLLNISTQVTNNSIVARPVNYGGCSGVLIPDFLTLGSLAGFTFGEGFTDSNLLIGAGTYDEVANTFTPAGMGVLSTDWYFNLTDDSETCMDTLKVRAHVTCPVNCSGDPYFWTGCTSTDWGAAGNWNLGIMPTAIDTVTITAFPAGGNFPEVLLPTTVKHLDLRPGSQVTINSGAELTIQE